MCQIHQYLLPVKERTSSRSTRQSIDFLKLTKEQIEYMRTHRTTELPPGMYMEHRFGTTKQTKDDIVEIVYVGFTLKRTFKQNICLMRDGTVVFCNRFLPSTAVASVSADNNEEEDDGKPLIAGFQFQKVSYHN